MESPLCSMKDFQNFSTINSIDFLNNCYYVILSKEGVINNVNDANNVLQQKIELPSIEKLREARIGNLTGKLEEKKSTGGDLTNEYKRHIVSELENINIIEQPGNYLFLFKLDISEDNKYNNSYYQIPTINSNTFIKNKHKFKNIS